LLGGEWGLDSVVFAELNSTIDAAMNRTRTFSPLVSICVALLAAGSCLDALGGLSLTNIPPAGLDSSNEGRAITPDGKYVGGLSGAGNGFFYDVANSFVTVPLAGSYASIVTGIGYRTDTSQSPPVVQVVLDGNNSGWHAQFETSDGGFTWGFKRRDNVSPNAYGWSEYPPPAANTLAATADSDVYFTLFRDSARNNLYTCRGSNLWNSTTAASVRIVGKGLGSDRGDVGGVAASGRIVGYRQVTGAPRKNYVLDYPNSSGTAWFFNGLNGTTDGQAFSISLDGNSIFGQSPLTVGGTNMHGYKATVTSAMNSLQSVDPLPNFSDTAGSSSLAVPYGCSADGQYAVGMNYRGKETAVLWDTSHSNPANWTVNDLHALAAANGTADIFVELTRAFSVGTTPDGDPVITGYGTDGAARRAFLMTVPRWIAAIGFPGHQTVNHGENVTFQLTTNGMDSLTYQWHKDGAPLVDGGNVSGAASSALTLAGVSCPGGDAGNYHVVVSNTALSSVVTGYVARLEINDPWIAAQPVHQTNVLGSTASFTVVASGSTPLSYQWQRGGFNLTDGDTGYGSIVAGATSATLTISNIADPDAYSGEYSVLVSGSASCQIASAAVTLTIGDPPLRLVSIVQSAPGNIALSFTGPRGQTYQLLYSTDVTLPLHAWIPLTQGMFDVGPVTFVDTPAPADSQRFYILAGGI